MSSILQKKQLPFEFALPPYMGEEDFIVSKCNSEAYKTLTSWPAWPFFSVSIYGAKFCGKTHLANIFADTVRKKTNSPYPLPIVDASMVDLSMPDFLFEKSRCLIVENLSTNVNQEALFHLYNTYNNNGGCILWTSLQAPARMQFLLPDLQSRLNAVPAVAIAEPDDNLLSALIVKLFMDRQIVASLDVINYIVLNMYRSFAYAHKLVREIDNISLAYKRAITIPIVKEAMEQLLHNQQFELF